MPPRLDLTPEQYAARVKEQARVRQARLRERRHVTGNVTRHVTGPTSGAPAPTSADVRSTAPVTTIQPLSPPLPPTAPKEPSKSGAVIDGLRAAGLCDQLSKRDHGAIKASGLSPEQIVEAFGAIARGEWGDAWLRTHLSVSLAVDRYPGFDAARRFPAAASGRAGAGRKSTGTRILEHYGYGTD